MSVKQRGKRREIPSDPAAPKAHGWMRAALFHLLHVHFHSVIIMLDRPLPTFFFLITLNAKRFFFIFSSSPSLPFSLVSKSKTRRPLCLLSLCKLEISARGSSCHLRLIARFSPALAIIAPLLLYERDRFPGSAG